MNAYSDADFRRSIWSALRLIALAVVLSVPLIWWKLGWRSAALFGIGAAISGSGLYEWLRLMTAVMARMDLDGGAPVGGEPAAPARPLAPVLILFFLRLALALAVLYVSLEFLDGSVYAMLAGLALGVIALTIESIRLIKSWTL